MRSITDSKSLFLFVVIIGMIYNRGLRLHNVMKVYKNMNFNDQNCKLKGSFGGAEDMSMGKQSLLFIGASGGLHDCFFHGSSSVENGGVYILDMNQFDPEPTQLKIHDYPYESIHVHGIFVSNQTDKLYLVNHLGPESTVEVVQIIYTPTVTLTHLRSVKSALFPRYGINDVVEGIDENEIYVTRWQSFSMPEQGTTNPTGLTEGILGYLTHLNPFFGLKLTLVYRCDLDKKECAPATENLFVGANGMTTSPDRQHYFVADWVEKKIGVFKRLPSGWLDFEAWIPLPFGIDNLEYDADSGEIMVGTIPDFRSVVRNVIDPEFHVPGGLSIVYQDQAGEWKTKDVLMHDGSKLSQISSGHRYRNLVVLGAPQSPGILICTI